MKILMKKDLKIMKLDGNADADGDGMLNNEDKIFRVRVRVARFWELLGV